MDSFSLQSYSLCECSVEVVAVQAIVAKGDCRSCPERGNTIVVSGDRRSGNTHCSAVRGVDTGIDIVAQQ